jgi:hypothetical protein
MGRRYHNSRSQGAEVDPDLQELALLIGMANQSQGPQLQQQELMQRDEAADMEAALGVLGMLMKQQQEEATLGATERQNAAMLEATERQAGEKLTTERDIRMKEARFGLINDMLRANRPWSEVEPWAAQLGPEEKALVEQQSQQRRAEAIQRMEAEIKGVYLQPKAQQDSATMHAGLTDLLKADQEAFNAADWPVLNQLLVKPAKPKPSKPVPTTPGKDYPFTRWGA